MFDWTTMWRDAQERSVLYPLFTVYNNFMNIRRFENFPFYVQPGAAKLSSFEDSVIKFCDHLVDAHELERNKNDARKSFYSRANYVFRNFHRYSNDTMANLTFDTKLRKNEYDRLNNIIDTQTQKYYIGATLTHFSYMAYASYFFRYRTLNKLQVLAVGTAYYFAFNFINNIQYKVVVEKPVIDEARKMGLDHFVQPNGSFRPRLLNF